MKRAGILGFLVSTLAAPGVFAQAAAPAPARPAQARPAAARPAAGTAARPAAGTAARPAARPAAGTAARPAAGRPGTRPGARPATTAAGATRNGAATAAPAAATPDEAAAATDASATSGTPTPPAADTTGTPPVTPPAAPETAITASPTPAATQVAVVDSAPIGVDPAAAAFVTDTLKQALTQLGYAPVATQPLYDAARALQLPFPVPPEGVAALLTRLQVPVGVAAEVRAGGGYYQLVVRVRFINEPSERYRQIVATQWTLGDSVRNALPGLLAPPGAIPQTPGPPGMMGPMLPDMSQMPPPRPRRRVRIHRNPIDLALGVELAFGIGTDPFVNFLGYVRGAYFFHDRFGITLSAGYANLRGRGQSRVSNFLPMLGIETGIDLPFTTAARVYLPIRLEVGYLPYNGPVGRATLGLAIPVTRDVRIEADFSPTAWFLPGLTAISFDVGLQLVIGFGAPPPRRRSRRTEPGAAETSDEATEPAREGTTTPAGASEPSAPNGETPPASGTQPPAPGSSAPPANNTAPAGTTATPPPPAPGGPASPATVDSDD